MFSVSVNTMDIFLTSCILDNRTFLAVDIYGHGIVGHVKAIAVRRLILIKNRSCVVDCPGNCNLGFG